MEIEHCASDASAKDIWNRLYAFNRSIAGDDHHQLLRLLAKESGKIVGGLLGGTYWGYLYVDALIVDAEYQGRGVGTRLLEEAERIATERGCQHACLDTHDFQGVGFYRRKGYETVGSLPDLPPGHTKYRMYKKLTISSTRCSSKR